MLSQNVTRSLDRYHKREQTISCGTDGHHFFVHSTKTRARREACNRRAAYLVNAAESGRIPAKVEPRQWYVKPGGQLSAQVEAPPRCVFTCATTSVRTSLGQKGPVRAFEGKVLVLGWGFDVKVGAWPTLMLCVLTMNILTKTEARYWC